jgi:hypothetical protein
MTLHRIVGHARFDWGLHGDTWEFVPRSEAERHLVEDGLTPREVAERLEYLERHPKIFVADVGMLFPDRVSAARALLKIECDTEASADAALRAEGVWAERGV